MLVLLFIVALIITIVDNTDEAALSVLIIPLSIFFALFMLRIRKEVRRNIEPYLCIRNIYYKYCKIFR